MQQQDAASDESTGAALYRRFAPVLFAFLYKLAPSREEAEDLLLEVFLAAMERANLVGMSEREQQLWLLKVARNKVAGRYRRMARHPQVALRSVEEALYADEREEPEQVAMQREAYANLDATLKKLPALQQEVLRLRFGHGLRYAEIAVLLEKKEGAVRMLLARTLKFLRDVYQRHEREEGVL